MVEGHNTQRKDGGVGEGESVSGAWQGHRQSLWRLSSSAYLF